MKILTFSITILTLQIVLASSSNISVVSIADELSDFDDDYPTVSVIQPDNISPIKKSNIRPGIRAFDLPFNTTITIKCVGNRELAWSFPELHLEEEDSIERSAEISHSCRSDGPNRRKCVSKVYFRETSSHHTGYYTCYYNGTVNPTIAFTTNEYPREAEAASLATVFFFVDEEPFALIPNHGTRGMLFMAHTEGHPVTIPCIPLQSSYPVTYWKVYNSSYSEQVKIGPEHGSSFDPTRGFSFESVHYDQSYKEVHCKATNSKGIVEDCQIIVHWFYDPGNLHPEILDDDAKYVSIGGSFSLTCALTAVAGVSFSTMKWELPMKNDSRVSFEWNNKGGREIVNNAQTSTETETISHKVTVKDVRPSDEGTYKCIVQAAFKTYTVEHYVVVHSMPFHDPIMNLSLGQSNDDIDGQNVIRTNERFVSDNSLRVTSPLILASMFLFLMILVGIFGGLIIRERRAFQQRKFFDLSSFEEGQKSLINPDIPLDEQVELLPYDRRFEFPRDRLVLGKVLGQGHFGRVVQAEAHGLDSHEPSTTVAVKMLKANRDWEQQKALIAELKILIHLGRHLNIVNLLAACTVGIHKGELLVIVEFCKYGNIRDFLFNNRHNFINQIDPVSGGIDSNIAIRPNAKDNHRKKEEIEPYYKSLPTTTSNYDVPPVLKYCSLDFSPSTFLPDNLQEKLPEYNNQPEKIIEKEDQSDIVINTRNLICFAYQVSRGMEYMSSRKLIHRDLAARNVLLADNFVVKICDFGLAKNCYRSDEYVKKGNGPLPIKWMAIESMRDKVFNTKSDVWSFAITCWEFFTLGEIPYPGMVGDYDFYQLIREGYRMKKPPFCPQSFFDHIMSKCWLENPDDRPTFGDLTIHLGNLLESSVRDYYLDLNVKFEEMNRNLFGVNPIHLDRSYVNADVSESSFDAEQRHVVVNEAYQEV